MTSPHAGLLQSTDFARAAICQDDGQRYGARARRARAGCLNLEPGVL